ncbi:hypothetical protein GDO86_009744 [Hymenochirus boettgeri]|uniref:Uncharacterized protein n=1 Tax=Hymenochirus boettgeri TaxID=247094 RepID=A0A8T2JHP2_9PIPI|nr:hypothetical protein GDO86_009744 [Hymenochirus boettgeri]
MNVHLFAIEYKNALSSGDMSGQLYVVLYNIKYSLQNSTGSSPLFNLAFSRALVPLTSLPPIRRCNSHNLSDEFPQLPLRSADAPLCVPTGAES